MVHEDLKYLYAVLVWAFGGDDGLENKVVIKIEEKDQKILGNMIGQWEKKEMKLTTGFQNMYQENVELIGQIVDLYNL